MDRRKYVSYRILKDFRERFIQPFLHLEINLHILVGNHDIYFRNTNDVNSLQELLGANYKNIHIYPENTRGRLWWVSNTDDALDKSTE